METADGKLSTAKAGWTRVISGFEHIVIIVLMGLLMVIVGISTVELGRTLFRDLMSAQLLLLDSEEMFDLFGLFLIVLIGLELNSSLKSYVRLGVVRGDVVIEVALIAIAQKLIILDMSRYGGAALAGLAALVLGLAVAFWLVRMAYANKDYPPVN